jgi:hypothetical protein
MAIKPGLGRKEKKNPNFFSHEFVIQNHADIVSCVAMVFVVGLMVQVGWPSPMFSLPAKVQQVFTTLEWIPSTWHRKIQPKFEKKNWLQNWNTATSYNFFLAIRITLLSPQVFSIHSKKSLHVYLSINE